MHAGGGADSRLESTLPAIKANCFMNRSREQTKGGAANGRGIRRPTGKGLLLLRRDNRIFEGFCKTELHHRLGGNFDSFAGLRVAAHTSLSIGLDGFA
jgi:hypothetical protein